VRLDPLLLFTCAVLVLLGTIAQINPVWLVGPYQPGSISSGAVPDWYMGFLDGQLRIMPTWELPVGGHPLALGVLIAGLVEPALFFTCLAVYPMADRRITGGRPARGLLPPAPVQGVESGAATAPFTAALVEHAPPHQRLVPILGSVGLTGGLAVGSLFAGLPIQLTPSANTIAFVVLSALWCPLWPLLRHRSPRYRRFKTCAPGPTRPWFYLAMSAPRRAFTGTPTLHS
jgi:hypothetical protein